MDEKPINDPGHVGPEVTPGWLDTARQVLMFLLGLWLIVYAATTNGHDLPFLITGLILFGMIPTERFLDKKFSGGSSRREERREERDSPTE